MSFKLMHFIFLILVTVFSSVTSKTVTGNAVERPVLIGAFNIQNLGQRKMKNETLMDIIKKVLLRYDLVLIQEIVTTDKELMNQLVKDLNSMHSETGSKFEMQISDRLGRGTAKEQYAYVYRDDKFKFLAGHSFPDKNDDFMRPPYIAHFATPTLRDMKSMIVIGIHTQPKNAANETSALAEVYDYAAKKFRVKDAIIMGDMNAGCANVRLSDWANIELWMREDFTWLIDDDFDTTLATNCCPYDRMVIAGENMNDAIIWESIGTFKFRDEYSIPTEMALAVSDHWPIEVKLKGGTSQQARTNLKPSLCLTVHDVRKKSLPVQLRNQKSTYGFSIESSAEFTELYSESEDDSIELLQNFQSLQSKYQQLISSDVSDTLLYKVEHGALVDVTAHDELEERVFSIMVHFDAVEKTTTVHYCVTTTIN